MLGRSTRLVRILGWIAAANAIAIALALMPAGVDADGSVRAFLSFCGIG
ncbi:MAG: hypothetical protein AB7F65_04830 [Dehalococcoidia bacterium]